MACKIPFPTYIFMYSTYPTQERMVTIMDRDKVVCFCNGVTNGMIKDAVDAGASTLEEVQEATSAGTVCGACLEDLENLVDAFVKERNS